MFVTELNKWAGKDYRSYSTCRDGIEKQYLPGVSLVVYDFCYEV